MGNNSTEVSVNIQTIIQNRHSFLAQIIHLMGVNNVGEVSTVEGVNIRNGANIIEGVNIINGINIIEGVNIKGTNIVDWVKIVGQQFVYFN